MNRRSLVLVALVAIVLAACGGSDPTVEAVIDPEGETTGFADFSNGTEKTFGVFICTNGGEVGVKTVSPVKTEGDIAYLGASIYTSPDMFVGAAHGYPADGIDESRIDPAEGASLESDCADPEGDNRVQLLIGAQRIGAGGGVIDGVILTTSDGQELEIPLTILLCGNEMEYCEILVPEEENGA
jgi:hypothetical protein